MYIKDNKAYPKGLVELEAQENNMSLEDYVSQNDFSLLEESEGKPTDPPKKNQSGDQEEVKTDGESSSVNGSLESPGPSPTPQTTGFPGLDLAIEDAVDAPKTKLDEYKQSLKDINKFNSKTQIAAIAMGYGEFEGKYYPISYIRGLEEGITGDNPRVRAMLGSSGSATPEQRTKFYENINSVLGSNIDIKNPNYEEGLTAAQMSAGFDLQWADVDEIAEGVISNKSKFSDNFINDIENNEERAEFRKQVLKFGSEDAEFNIAVGAGVDPETAILKESQRLEIDAKNNLQAAENLDIETKDWLTRKNKLETAIKAAEAQFKAADRLELPVVIAPKGFAFNEEKYKKSIEEYNAIVKQKQDAYNAYKSLFESDEYNWVTNTQNSLIERSENIEAEEARLTKKNKDLGNTQIMIDSLGKNYSKLSKLGFNLENSLFGSLAAAGEIIAGAFQELNKFITEGEEPEGFVDEANLAVYDALEKFEGYTIDYRQDLAARQGLLPHERDYSEAKAAGKVGEWYLDATINAVPTLAAIFIPSMRANALTRSAIKKTGKVLTKSEKLVIQKGFQKQAQQYTMLTFGVMEGGGWAQQTKNTIEQKEALLIDNNAEIIRLKKELANSDNPEEIQKQIDEKTAQIREEDGYLSLSNLEMVPISGAHAFVATTAERLGTLRQLSKIQQGVRGIGYRTFRKYVSMPVAKFAAGVTGKLKALTGGVVVEEIEELVTLTGNNFLDGHLGGLDVHITEGVDAEFFRQIALTSALINAKGMAPQIKNSVVQVFKTRSDNQKVVDLVAQASSITQEISDIIESGKGPENLKRIKALERQRDEIYKSILRSDVDAIARGNDLTQEDLEEIAKADLELNRLYQEAASLSGETQRSEETNKALETLKFKIQEQVAIREGLLGKSQEKINELAKQAENKAEAMLNYADFEYSRAFGKAEGKDNYIEVGQDTDIDAIENLTDDEKANAKEAREKGNNATYLNGKSIVFVDNVRAYIQLGGENAKFAARSPLHEFGHKLIRKLGIIKGKKLVGISDNLVQNLLDYLQIQNENGSLNNDSYQFAQDRIERYKKKNKGQHDADELLQLLSDLVSQGSLRNSAFGEIFQIKSFINTALSKASKRIDKDSDFAPFFKIDTAQDALRFVNHQANRFSEGKQVAMLPPEEGEAKASISQLNTKLEQDYDNNPRKLVNDMLTFPLQESPFAKEIGGITENITKRLYDPIPAEQKQTLSRSEFKDALIGEAATLVTNEYKVGEQSLDKFVSTRLNLRANNLASRLGIESTITEDVSERKDIQTGEDVAEAIDKPVEDKPEFKKLTAYKGNQAFISEDAMPEVERTVSRVVGAPSFTAKFDERAPDGKQTSNFIAALKKQFGNSILVDRIKAKSIVKSKTGTTAQAFERFMLQNKKAILENMTTTYLQTAFPHAVEKSVDGVFVRFPAWLGKKIDRETTGQGNDLVRRVPNVAQAVSDEQYLEDIRTNPLKGGKEVRSAAKQNSVLKAIAEEMGIEMVVDAIKDPNSDIYKALVRRQGELGVTEEQITAVEAQVQAERGNVKFSIGSKGFTAKQLREFADAANFDVETAEGRGKLINLYYKKKGIPEIYKLDSETDINNYITAVKKYILPLLPKSAFFSSDIDSGSSAFRRSSRFVGDKNLDKYFIDKINELRALDKDAVDEDGNRIFGEEIPNLGKKPKGSYEAALGNNDQQFEQKSEDGSWDLFNDYHGKIHAEAWKRVDALVKRAQELRKNEDTKQEGDDILRVLGNYFSIVSNDKSHWHKMGAQMVAWSPNAIGEQRTSKKTGKVTTKKYEWEHGVPATRSYIFLINASLDGVNFELAYNAVQSQNKLIALDAALNKNLQESGLATKMTNKDKGWNFLFNDFFERYAEAGINLDELMVNTKTSLAQAAGVSADGTRLTPRGIGFSQLVMQQNFQEAKEKIKEIENAPKPTLSKASIGNLSKEFNNILERKTGIESFKTFSDVQAEIRGRNKGKFKFFIAPAVDDFRGLVNYAFSGKGKQGEIDKQWLEDKLMTPYAKGISAIEGIRQQIKRDFKAAVKSFPKQYKLLNKTIGTSPFTYDHAVRVYLWQKAGFDTIPGLSKKDTKVLQDAIQAQPELIDFANSLLTVARRDEWMPPTEHWVAGTVLSDLNGMTEKIGRKKYLEEFIANAEVIFSKENLNKIEAAFGRNHREAIEDALYSMINGTNRSTGASQNKTVGKWLNWINGSTGAIMFFNRRSALLQMLSTVNFINYTDNNPVKAAAAFANQKQYWKDFAMIFNSDKLKERRGGLQQDVSSDEIASIANKNNRSPQALLARLLKLGFTPTQIADSMAIASGGATFYRNRVNTYIKQGMDQAAAEKQAFLDFSKISDETQQSSDPALVSQVQRSVLGRIVFAFQNTPMQMTRLMKKDALDLINGRGDWKVKVARIAYYGAIQNAIFSSLQSALFALIPGFDDEDDEDLTEEELIKRNTQEEGKIARALNSMLDTLLRGSGVYGAILAAAKNVIKEYDKQEKKGFLGDHSYTILSLFDISPPIGSKARKINTAIKTRTFEKDAIAERGWAVTAEGRLNLGPNWSILGNVVSATTNVPLDRVVAELTSVAEAFNAKNTAWQRVALGAGWKTWDVGVENEVNERIKEAAKERRKEEGIIKARETRKTKRKAKEEEIMKNLLKNIQTQDSIIEYNKGKK